MESIFTDIYNDNKWGKDISKEYKGCSGVGSKISYNTEYIDYLKKWITDNDIKSVVDFGCGDFQCGKLIYDDLNIKYTGYDAYEDVIQHHKKNIIDDKYDFIHSDIFSNKEKLISGDVCILKDVLQHWKNEDIYTFLDYISESGKYKYILICNSCNQKKDNQSIVKTGNFRPLNYNMYPLKKYNPKKLFDYKTKEVCLIQNTS